MSGFDNVAQSHHEPQQHLPVRQYLFSDYQQTHICITILN